MGTIVVDEAHHLKNAWWRSLTKVKKALNPTVVGLTATPPYDVSHSEWQRYIELNGPVDAEISVPELVVEGDLCPHQDYVMLSRPTLEEMQKIDEHRRRLSALFDEIKEDSELITALEGHPCFANPTGNLEWIYVNFEYYAATLIFMSSIGRKVTETHREVVGDRELTVPDFDYKWMEALLTFYLYKDSESFGMYEKHQNWLVNRLKRNGALERRNIDFRSNGRVNSYHSSSLSKLKSIDRIVEFEREHLGPGLRMVILTDYIRKEYLVKGEENTVELNKMGVMPIFEQLRRTNSQNEKLGVLTGSLIIIPAAAIGALNEVAENYGIHDIGTNVLPFDKNYLLLELSERLRRDIVHIITQIFQSGHIEVLVGTKSLLGEGWDAPSINSLILASFVGSYVLSNQMRGRAIRTERENASKASNIWHLVCVDPTVVDRGSDFQLLERRFKVFVGVSFGDDVGIENGFKRLRMSQEPGDGDQIDADNELMFSRASNRDELAEKWRKALETGTAMVEEMEVPFPRRSNFRGSGNGQLCGSPNSVAVSGTRYDAANAYGKPGRIE